MLLNIASVAALGVYLRSYLGEKAKNLAAKEDIMEITDRIEGVKIDYSKQLESIKNGFQARLQVDQVRYQNEYQILVTLSERLVELRDAATSLRPALDIHPADEAEVDRKKRRLERYAKAAQEYYQFSATREPFILEDMYQTVIALERHCRSEAIKFNRKSPNKDPGEYWDEAEENAQLIETSANELIQKIRKRAKLWEL